jgi:hypothetical protein
MTRKRSGNRITEIMPEFGNVLVCNKNQLRPFMEIIIEEPENVSHHNLGTLIGVLEITDTSEDSSYIVNYLISVIKKEYFSKTKRGPIESLEAALHKANLALANLAEHKNINWLGKLNALIAVTEKNNLHLSQAGTASAFLLRSQTLTDISEGLSQSDSEPSPLKTFVSVSSGRLEEDDKLLITTDSIFDIFSLEEIKKSALRFSNEEFIQFLKTALGNELEKAAVLVADFKVQKKAVQEKPYVDPQKELNAFSKDAFIGSARKNKPQEAEKTIEEEIRESPQEFVNEKTGHIYIKEGYETLEPPKEKVDYAKIIWEKIMGLIGSIPVFLKKIPRPNPKIIRLPQTPKINLDTQGLKDKSRQAFEKIHHRFKKYSDKSSIPAERRISEEGSGQKISLQQKITVIILSLKKISEKFSAVSRFVAPSFSKMRKSFSEMEYQQKIYIILALILIFIAPIFIIKIQDGMNEKEMASLEEESRPLPVPLENDVNVVRIESPGAAYSANGIIQMLNLNGQIFAITASDIIDIKSDENFPVPQNFQSPPLATQMNDLNLIFLFNSQNEITSFSPISKKFQSNSLPVPAGSKVSAIGTYLTYIYLVDEANDQIYRYPRAEGGFGEKTDWLKDTFDFANMTDMAINENIFISHANQITKLFRGRNENISLPQTATPINADKISLGDQTADLFILDKQNSRVVRIDPENNIKVQYYHPEIGAANGLAIDEKTGLIYISTEKDIWTIPLEL